LSKECWRFLLKAIAFIPIAAALQKCTHKMILGEFGCEILIGFFSSTFLKYPWIQVDSWRDASESQRNAYWARNGPTVGPTLAHATDSAARTATSKGPNSALGGWSGDTQY
jgi:hypothetical protein